MREPEHGERPSTSAIARQRPRRAPRWCWMHIDQQRPTTAEEEATG
jgi:hypothetical protein